MHRDRRFGVCNLKLAERYRLIAEPVLKTLRRASREAARRGSLAGNNRLSGLNRGSLRLADQQPGAERKSGFCVSCVKLQMPSRPGRSNLYEGRISGAAGVPMADPPDSEAMRFQESAH